MLLTAARSGAVSDAHVDVAASTWSETDIVPASESVMGRLAIEKIGLPLNGAYPKTVYSPKAISVASSSFDVAF
jgi:hypothetical protein